MEPLGPGVRAIAVPCRRSSRGEAGAPHEPGWYEWTLREFLRYWYVLGVVALLVFVPLQMLDSLSSANPALLDVAIVGVVFGFLAAGGFGYWYLWKLGGWVDRRVLNHDARRAGAARPMRDK